MCRYSKKIIELVSSFFEGRVIFCMYIWLNIILLMRFLINSLFPQFPFKFRFKYVHAFRFQFHFNFGTLKYRTNFHFCSKMFFPGRNILLTLFVALPPPTFSKTNQEPVNIGFIFSLPWDVSNTVSTITRLLDNSALIFMRNFETMLVNKIPKCKTLRGRHTYLHFLRVILF